MTIAHSIGNGDRIVSFHVPFRFVYGWHQWTILVTSPTTYHETKEATLGGQWHAVYLL